MKTIDKPIKETGFFSDLVCDYIDGPKHFDKLIAHRPKIAELRDYAESRIFPTSQRETLTSVLREQYENVGIDTPGNVRKLLDDDVFTVTTGHQLNIFTGPLFVIYKILHTIKLADELTTGRKKVVPVLWMATEDHDLEEINHFMLFNDRVEWKTKEKGAVGRMKCDGLEKIVDTVDTRLGKSENERALVKIFRDAYTPGRSLGEATRLIYHRLFGDRGLVIIDADDARLKGLAKGVFRKEIEESSTKKAMQTAINQLHAEYSIQVTPRDVNLFYLTKENRIRIERSDEGFVGVDSDLSWSKEELLQILESNPERISPNVALRPVYQEVILPNLAYTGGGGELAYWMELKPVFEAMDVPYPAVFLRNSFLLVDSGIQKKLDRMGIETSDMFGDVEALIRDYIKRVSDEDIDLSEQKSKLARVFETLTSRVVEVDGSLKGKVEALLAKTMGEIDDLEKRLIKTSKEKQETNVNQIYKIKDRLFPDNGLQERSENLILWYMKTGPAFFNMIYENITTETKNFRVIEL